MKVGLQLYSARINMRNDPMGTIRKVAEQGYRYLEVANNNADEDSGIGFDVTPQEVRRLLDETGAAVVSAHITPLTLKNVGPLLEYHSRLGTRFLVEPMPFYRDMDDVARKAESLNLLGEKCADYGLQLLYHNHFHEFQHFGDETVYEKLMRETDPELVKIELDTYWCFRANCDIAGLLKKYGKRVCILHQKDYTKGLEAERDLLTEVEKNHTCVDRDFFRGVRFETFTEIGTGVMDIQTIIDTANKECGTEYIILEQDRIQMDEMESFKISMDSFKRFHGVEW